MRSALYRCAVATRDRSLIITVVAGDVGSRWIRPRTCSQQQRRQANLSHSRQETLKVGVIGCGFFAQNHLHSWQALQGVSVAALCDVNPEALHATATRFGVAKETCFTDPAAMLATSGHG